MYEVLLIFWRLTFYILRDSLEVERLVTTLYAFRNVYLKTGYICIITWLCQNLKIPNYTHCFLYHYYFSTFLYVWLLPDSKNYYSLEDGKTDTYEKYSLLPPLCHSKRRRVYLQNISAQIRFAYVCRLIPSFI